MIVNRSGSKIFGAHLTKTEQKALDIEAKKAVLQCEEQYRADLDAAILYFLHTKYGFGVKRLREFWDGFNALHEEMIQHYMVESADAAWVCRDKLKQIGVDVVKWYEEDLKGAKDDV